MSSVVVPLLVPVVTAVIGAIGLMLKDRRLAHDSRAIREKALAEASAQIGFATDWWKAQQLLGADHASDANQKLRAWLLEAETTVTAARQIQVDRNPVTVRKLFLFEPMHRTSSKLLRILFWISALWLVLGAAVTAGDAHPGGGFGGDIAFLSFCAVITIVLHEWAEANERKARPGPDRPSSQKPASVTADAPVTSCDSAAPDGAPLTKSV